MRRDLAALRSRRAGTRKARALARLADTAHPATDDLQHLLADAAGVRLASQDQRYLHVHGKNGRLV